jgi:predicted NAD/FAD-binding protein
MKIAVIGSGISGIGSSYILKKNNDVTLFEQSSVGGHTHTIDVPTESSNKKTPVDIGNGFSCRIYRV